MGFAIGRALLLVVLTGLANCAIAGLFEAKVHEVTGQLPEFPAIDVTNPDRFLNDLMLSPCWYVIKERDGSYTALARSVSAESPFKHGQGKFLFEMMAGEDKTLPEGYRINNEYLFESQPFLSFSICIVFERPSGATLGKSGKPAKLPVYESYAKELGGNSSSNLAISLSSEHEIYVVLREQGADPARAATFARVEPTLRELAEIAKSPAQYRVEQRYAEFFDLFFKQPLKEQELRRFPGLQDRDTFYGYFQAKPQVSYYGINLKVSHPVYCPEEGTRKSERLRKAEYLGKPYLPDDRLFFLIEDNALYLPGEYDERFGTFTGKESFDGTLEILNDQDVVLLKTTRKFKGWQR